MAKIIDEAGHNGCRVKGRIILWQRLLADYRCDSCGGGLVRRKVYDDEYTAASVEYYVECRACGARDDVVHKRALARERLEAEEVLANLPREMLEVLGATGGELAAEDIAAARAELRGTHEESDPESVRRAAESHRSFRKEKQKCLSQD